jgi:predicted transcriptional regulator
MLSVMQSINRALYIYKGVDVVEWSRALDVRLSEWCCSVTMVWVQISSREEQKFDSSKI